MKLQGKVALITGASSGIGYGCAAAMAREGADIVANYYKGDDGARKLLQEIEELGRRAVAVDADVARKIEVNRLMSESLETFGRIDVLVNNAGIEHITPFLDIPEEEWQRVIDVNLKGQFFVGQAVARHMVERSIRGSIVNISSVQSVMAAPGRAHYASTKAAVAQLTRNMALELAPDRIRANAIAPGLIRTGMTEQFWEDPELIEALMGSIPWGREGSPEEVGRVAAFLASDDASYITGATLFVDGGMTIQ